MGYLIVAVIQSSIALIVFLSLPMWKKTTESKSEEDYGRALKMKEIFAIPGAISCFVTFFAYCALEVTASLWASSYLVQNRGIDPETASAFASLFYIGISVGRAVNGFLAMRFSDKALIRVGSGIICVGIGLLVLPFHSALALAGFVIMGLGCAPIYPCIIHMTPATFGRERSQAMIGIQMAFAYTGFLITPPVFGFIAEYTTIALLPALLFALLLLMVVTHERVVNKTKK
jgi:fucose permease